MLRGMIGIRPEERRGALAAFATDFGILAAHTLLETARDALFLSRLPASAASLGLPGHCRGGGRHLPGAHRLATRSGRGWGLPSLLLGCASVTFGFWLVRLLAQPRGLYALYMWTGLVGSLAVLQFWLVLGDLYTVSQAKRIYSVVGTGSLLGAAGGAGLARYLTAIGQTSHPGARGGDHDGGHGAGAGAAPALAQRGDGRRAAARPPSPTLQEAVRLFKGHPYVRGAGGLRPGLHRGPDPGRLRLQEHGRAQHSRGRTSDPSSPPSTWS